MANSSPAPPQPPLAEEEDEFTDRELLERIRFKQRDIMFKIGDITVELHTIRRLIHLSDDKLNILLESAGSTTVAKTEPVLENLISPGEPSSKLRRDVALLIATLIGVVVLGISALVYVVKHYP